MRIRPCIWFRFVIWSGRRCELCLCLSYALFLYHFIWIVARLSHWRVFFFLRAYKNRAKSNVFSLTILNCESREKETEKSIKQNATSIDHSNWLERRKKNSKCKCIRTHSVWLLPPRFYFIFICDEDEWLLSDISKQPRRSMRQMRDSIER